MLSRIENEEMLVFVIRRLVEAHGRLDRLLAAVEAGDMTTVRWEAQALKAVFGAIGADKARARAGALETACREGRAGDAVALVPDVADMAQETIRALEKLYRKVLDDSA